MLKLLCSQEKLNVIRKLETLIKKFKREENNEMWWHSSRINYSLKHELVPQTVYVDKYPEFNFIISRYTYKDSGNGVEVYTSSNKDVPVIKEACCAAIGMIAEGNMSYGQIQSSPFYLYSYLWDAVKKYKLNVFEDVGANSMSFPFAKINKLNGDIKPVEGFFCEPLRKEDAELVNHRFKYANHPDTLKWITKSIQTLPSMGCRNHKKELVGQFICLESGNIGGLSVLDECKGLKLGKWIVQELTNLCYKRNMPIVLETEFTNRISYSLFTSLGFETYAQSYYMLLSKDTTITDAI